MKCSANKEWVDTNLFMWLLRGPVPEIRNVLLFQPQWNIRSDLYLLHHKHSFVLCLMNSLTYPRTHTRAREWKYMLKQIQVWFVEYSSRCFMFYRGRGVYLKGSASPKRNMCNRGYGPRTTLWAHSNIYSFYHLYYFYIRAKLWKSIAHLDKICGTQEKDRIVLGNFIERRVCLVTSGI